jgi:hypothetical protein
MAEDAKNRIAFKPAPKVIRRERKTDVFSIAVTGIVIGVLIVALWISANAVIEKVHLSQGLRRIVGIVDTAREVAANDKAIGAQPADLVAMLEKLGRDHATGTEGDLKTLTNPWGGVLLATIVPPDHVRIETVVPSFACRRMVELLGEDVQALGIEQIDARGPREDWHRLYARGGSAIEENALLAGCGNAPQSGLVLTFALR